MTKAFGYIRCSGISQMDGDGPERQRIAISTYAKNHDIDVVRWFEESYTGSDLEGRDVFRGMRAELVSDGVRLVIVEKLDRLARSIMVQETILADFKKNAIQLHSATPGEDELNGDDPTRTLVRQILACFFEYERKMIVSKMADARRRTKAKIGRCEGQPPYGYANLKEDGRLVGLVVVPKEQEVIILTRESSRHGSSLDAIAQGLNAAGYHPRHGGKFYPMTVKRILERRLDPLIQG